MEPYITVHQQLASALAQLFAHPEFITGDMDIVQDAFVENLYKVLQTTLDINISQEKIEQYARDIQANPDPLTTARFLSTTLENEKTYTVLNYFFSHVILKFIDQVKPEQKNAAWDLVKSTGVDTKLFESVDTTYARLITP